MSVFGVDYGTISGGGGAAYGETVEVNGSEVSSVTTQNTEFVIKTGLSSISRFIYWDNPQVSGNPNWRHVIEYDGGNTCYAAIMAGASTQYNASLTVPSSTTNSYYPIITDITGGTITLKSANNEGNGKAYDIRWFAE